MKRFLPLFVLSLLLSAVFCTGVSAAGFDSAAEDLAAIGMLQGDASGFALDRAPTRSEAAIMLVRLFGAEEEAKAAYASGGLSHSFTDVSEFASPYVAWLTVRGIANGTSASTFGAASPCSGQMYAAFLLRALGYRDGADFAYADAETFAMTRGITNLSFGGAFLRDHLAGMTYQALGADLKDGSACLLESLIRSGAVDAGAAKPIMEKIQALRQLQAASLEGLDGALDADLSMKASFSVNAADQEGGAAIMAMDMSGSGSVQVILDEEDLQAALDLKIQMDGEEEAARLWLRDGVMYVQADGERYQQTLPGMAEVYQASAVSEQADGMLLPFLDSISVKTSGGTSVYTLQFNDALANAAGALVPLIFKTQDVDVDASMDGSSFTYTFGQNGKLKDAVVSIRLRAAVASGPVDLSVSLSVEMSMDVNASGKSVAISYPDFSGFQKAA